MVKTFIMSHLKHILQAFFLLVVTTGNAQNIRNPANNQQSYKPMGMTTDDLIRQQNRANMQRMGYNPPVVPSSDPTLSHQFILQQNSNQNKQQWQIAYIQSILAKDLPLIQNGKETKRLHQTRYFRQAFSEIKDMQIGIAPFSLKKTVFIIENAFMDNTMEYADYEKQIKIKSNALKMLMRKEKIELKDNLGKNYLIQKLFSQRIVEYKDTVVWRVHKPYKYDFEDFIGESNWSNMFVSKLLKTGKGQCHSMPLLYLILAKELDAKAWLSLAPEHSFIVFNDRNTFFNFETTSGNVVSTDWLMESGYVNSSSIKNRIYLDTLDQNDLVATLMVDLILGYTQKFGYDTYIDSKVNEVLQICPHNIQGQLLKANLLTLHTKQLLRKANNPSLDKIDQYPEAHASYTGLMKQYNLIDNLGYMAMPKEKYKEWLSSSKREEKKQDNQKPKTITIR